MNILIIGSGGREHAFAWKIAQSSIQKNIFVAPGNPGTAQIGTNIDIDVCDFESHKTFCLANKIDLVLVGPEDPLVNGIYDFFAQNELKHIHVIGPSKHAAMLEGSKAFAKQFMKKMNIPTAQYQEFTATKFDEGIDYIKQHTLPIVLKADGLAAGKGVVIAETHEDAIQTFTEMLLHKKFGNAGTTVVIESFLSGIECSVFVLTDGKNYHILPSAKDYKRIGEGDKGLNTGGMGAISPVPFVDELFMQKVVHNIIEPTIKGLQQEAMEYKGFIFIGLIKVQDEPFVIEYNCRMGDPETEVVLPRIENDLLPLLLSLKNQTLHEHSCNHVNQSAATVMLVSRGYPEQYEKGFVISNVASISNSLIFHAGTKLSNDQLLTNGGRVIAVTSLGESIQDAIATSLDNATNITFEGKYFRRDIGWEFL
jgi:phosphoribosylamine--glycine ligase